MSFNDVYSTLIEANPSKLDFGFGTEWNRMRFFDERKCLKTWWPGTESNRRRQPFQGCALPTELPGHSGIASGLSRTASDRKTLQDEREAWTACNTCMLPLNYSNPAHSVKNSTPLLSSDGRLKAVTSMLSELENEVALGSLRSLFPKVGDLLE